MERINSASINAQSGTSIALNDSDSGSTPTIGEANTQDNTNEISTSSTNRPWWDDFSQSPTSGEALAELKPESATSAAEPTKELGQKAPKKLEVHFYPGEKKIHLIDEKGNSVASFDAVGGPQTAKSDSNHPNDPSKMKTPTTPGKFVIGEAGPYHTRKWPYSKIDWGTSLRFNRRTNDVEYQLPSGKWGSMKKDFNITPEDVKKLNNKHYQQEKIPDTWLFNDFGPVAVQWYADTNHNGKMDNGESVSGEKIHTTPADEAKHSRRESVTLSESHGCIHIKPADREEIMKLGGFKAGNQLVIHNYTEKFTPPTNKPQ